MGITIKDVARESGFSVSTVSLALSDKKSRISDKTKIKIRTIADEMNYYPNRAAVNLVSKKSNIIGMLIADLKNPHVAVFFMTVDFILQKHGYNLLCRTTDENSNDYSLNVFNNIVSNGVAGLILAQPFDEKMKKEEIQRICTYLKNKELPIISRDVVELNECGMDIRFNYFEGAYIATRHLIEYGHRRIGCVTGTMDLRVTTDRISGYKRAIKEAGIPFDENLLYRGDYGLESSGQALSYLLGKKVSAIFSFNDEMAFGLYRSARQYNIKIPEDISIIGFDNVPFAEVLETPLTTINVPTEEMGIRVAEEMIHMIENPDEKVKDDIIYQPTLMIRGSVSKINS